MPFVLLIVGAVLFVSGVRGTNAQLWSLAEDDFTGNDSFLVWIAAIAVVGGLGYIKSLRPLSIAFMTLLLIVLFLSNKGVFEQLQSFVTSPQNGNTPTPTNGLQSLTPIQPLQPKVLDN